MIIQTALFLLFIILILIICLIVLQSININDTKTGTKTGTKTSNILLKYGGSMEDVKTAVNKLITAYEESDKHLIDIKKEKEDLEFVLNRVSAIEEDKHKNIEELATLRLELDKINNEGGIIKEQLSIAQQDNIAIREELSNNKDAHILQIKEIEGKLENTIKLKEERIEELLTAQTNALTAQAKKVIRPLIVSHNYERSLGKKSSMNYNNDPTYIIKQGDRIEEMIDFSSEVELLKTKINEKTAEIKSINDTMKLLKQEIEGLKKEIANDDEDKLKIIESINKVLLPSV
jgi:hypothetical protein